MPSGGCATRWAPSTKRRRRRLSEAGSACEDADERAMTFSHEQIQEHLLGFLEGGLTGEVRAAFDAHLSACDACRGEVRGFEQVRTLAREVVRAPLARPVPSELRARVLAAA